jgi:hypothetical protein
MKKIVLNIGGAYGKPVFMRRIGDECHKLQPENEINHIMVPANTVKDFPNCNLKNHLFHSFDTVFHNLVMYGLETQDVDINAHSLGFNAITKYMQSNGIKINTLNIAPGACGKLRRGLRNSLINQPMIDCFGYRLKEEQVVDLRNNCRTINCFVSDGDSFFSPKSLIDIPKFASADTVIYLPNQGHLHTRIGAKSILPTLAQANCGVDITSQSNEIILKHPTLSQLSTLQAQMERAESRGR